jgi:hypothetical protein
MREVSDPQAAAAKLPMLWPHLLVSIGELMLLNLTAQYLADYRKNEWAAIGLTLTFVQAILTVYQFGLCVRRKARTLVINAWRAKLYVVIGAAGAGAYKGVDGFPPTMIFWGLLSLWAYSSLDFMKRPFDRE